jgi:hypothetical protein
MEGTWSNFLNHWDITVGAVYRASAALAMGDEGVVRVTKPTQALHKSRLLWKQMTEMLSQVNVKRKREFTFAFSCKGANLVSGKAECWSTFHLLPAQVYFSP